MDITDIRFFENSAYLLKYSSLDSKDIEATLEHLTYTGQGRPIDEKVENSNIPYFAIAFFHFVFLNDRIPDEDDLIDHYLTFNKIESKGNFFMINCKRMSKWGVINRLLRSYPSLIRDFHFFKLCTESKKFDCVKYSLKEDVYDGIDLIVEHNQKKFCVATYTRTSRGKYFKKKKNSTRKDDQNCFKQIEFAIDLASNNIKKVSNFLLLSNAHVKELADKIHLYAQNQE